MNRIALFTLLLIIKILLLWTCVVKCKENVIFFLGHFLDCF